MEYKKDTLGDFLKQAGAVYAGVKLANKELAGEIDKSLQEHSERLERAQQEAEERKAQQEKERELDEAKFIAKNIKLAISENKLDSLADFSFPNNQYGWALRINLSCFLSVVQDKINMDSVEEALTVHGDTDNIGFNWIDFHRTWCESNNKKNKHKNVMIKLTEGFSKNRSEETLLAYMFYIHEDQELLIDLLSKDGDTNIGEAVDYSVMSCFLLQKENVGKIIERFYDRYYAYFKKEIESLNLKEYKENLVKYIDGKLSDDPNEAESLCQNIGLVNILFGGWCELCKIKHLNSTGENTLEIIPFIKNIIGVMDDIIEGCLNYKINPEIEYFYMEYEDILKSESVFDINNEDCSLFWQAFFLVQKNYPTLSKSLLEKVKLATEKRQKEISRENLFMKIRMVIIVIIAGGILFFMIRSCN